MSETDRMMTPQLLDEVDAICRRFGDRVQSVAYTFDYSALSERVEISFRQRATLSRPDSTAASTDAVRPETVSRLVSVGEWLTRDRLAGRQRDECRDRDMSR